MKVAFFCLHYGSDYLSYAIRSIIDVVDKVFIAYSPTPSHGHQGSSDNPDSKQKCYEAAHQNNSTHKIHWIEGKWAHEGDHRDSVFRTYPNARLISVVDADEIWHTDQFAAMQEWCLSQPAFAFKQKLRTLWRSFNWIVDDEMMPDRFYRLDQPRGTFRYTPREIGIFYHFGYARKPENIRYKLSIHGHKNELKARWFEDKYLAWSPNNNIGDLHPTCNNIWNAKPFDKSLLPTILENHPYRNLEVIV